jgi:hypothetical protein
VTCSLSSHCLNGMDRRPWGTWGCSKDGRQSRRMKHLIRRYWHDLTIVQSESIQLDCSGINQRLIVKRPKIDTDKSLERFAETVVAEERDREIDRKEIKDETGGD